MKQYSVIESREDEIRRHFSMRDVTRLNSKEKITMYEGSAYYSNPFKESDDSYCDGYFIYQDVAKQRFVNNFVCETIVKLIYFIYVVVDY